MDPHLVCWDNLSLGLVVISNYHWIGLREYSQES